MDARRTVELSVDVLFTVLRRENDDGDPHAILAGPEGYAPRRYRDEAVRAARAELARTGVGLDKDFRELLGLILHPSVEYYGWVDTGAESVGVLVAARGRSAVRLVRQGDRVAVGLADPDHLARSLVSVLPDVPPGHGSSISLRAADFASSAPAGGVMHRATAARSHDARRLDALLREPRLGGARLYAAARDRTGRRHRSADWLTVLDVARHGRWLVYPTAGAGDRAINAAPGTPALIATKLTDLGHAALRGTR